LVRRVEPHRRNVRGDHMVKNIIKQLFVIFYSFFFSAHSVVLSFIRISECDNQFGVILHALQVIFIYYIFAIIHTYIQFFFFSSLNSERCECEHVISLRYSVGEDITLNFSTLHDNFCFSLSFDLFVTHIFFDFSRLVLLKT